MRVKCRHTVGRLDRDYREIPAQAAVGMVHIVRENIAYGRDLARHSAQESAGKHGKHYHKSITAELHTGGMSGEYGPDPKLPQGGMLFEHGEGRQTKPHLDLAKSADHLPASTSRDVRMMLTRLFR